MTRVANRHRSFV